MFTPQADPTSTRQVNPPDNISVCKVIEAVGNNQLSVKEMMQLLSLADRENFLNNYLNPAIKTGFVRLLYPDSPRHPRQKYLLTVKGVGCFSGTSALILHSFRIRSAVPSNLSDTSFLQELDSAI